MRKGERGKKRNLKRKLMRERKCNLIGGNLDDNENRKRIGWGKNKESKRNENGMEFKERKDENMSEEGKRNEEKIKLRMEKKREIEWEDDVEMNGKIKEKEKRIKVERRDERIRKGRDGIKKILSMEKINLDGKGGRELEKIGKGKKEGLKESKKDGEKDLIKRKGEEMLRKLMESSKVERVNRLRNVDKECWEKIRM